MKVAILGANGFVGFRLFEKWMRHGPHSPRAVVRSPSSLARVARFRADWRLADARDQTALAVAFENCDAVVHCVTGDERVIAESVAPAYHAARTAGVRFFVYLSSSAVHGQNPPPGTDERSALHTNHALGYNNAKVRAERLLRRLAQREGPRVVVLRPGIVWGPRSRWVAETIAALRADRAAWVDDARGICNLCHVDNLVHAIECALTAPAGISGTYLVGDAETKTWRDFQGALARLVDCDETAFAEAQPTAPRPTHWSERLTGLKSTATVQTVLPWFSPRLKETVKAALARWTRPPLRDAFALPDAPEVPAASVEMSLLYACRVKLPHELAARELGYAPPVDFNEGLRRTAAWWSTCDDTAVSPRPLSR